MRFSKVLLFFGVLFIVSLQLKAQKDKTILATPSAWGVQWENAKGFTTTGHMLIEEGNEVTAIDGHENVYQAGSFFGTVVVGDRQLTSQGRRDIYFAKFDSTGALQWLRHWKADLGSQDRAVATDRDGNIYITGYYRHTLAFEDTVLTVTAGPQDVFIAKYSPDGHMEWVRVIRNELSTVAAMCLDSSGNVYIGGQKNFGAFVQKYTSQGALVWTKTGRPSSWVYDMVANNEDDLYITGSFRHELTLDGRRYTGMAWDVDMFTARLCRNGSDSVGWNWVVIGKSPDQIMGRGIVATPTGPVVTGIFRNRAILGDRVIEASDNQYYVVKYTLSGAVEWVNYVSDCLFSAGNSICTDAAGNFYVAGKYSGQFRGGDTTLINPGSMHMGFVLKLDAQGRTRWAYAPVTQHNGTYSTFEDVFLNAGGTIYCSGIISGGAAQFRYNYLRNGYFFAKLNQGSLSLNYPKAGSTYYQGDVIDIRWTAPPVLNTVTIDLSADNGLTWSTIAENIEGGSYTWPVSTINSRNCRLRARASYYPEYTDETGNFSILFPLKMTYPNGGETLKQGQPVTLQWSNPAGGKVDLYFSSDNGQTWQFIANSPGSAYNWTVPAQGGAACQIKVVSSSDPGIYDETDASFSVHYIKTISPQAGDVLNYGYSNYSWESYGVSAVNVDLSLNDGASWQRRSTNVTGNNVYIPIYTSGLFCKFRVTDVSSPVTTAISGTFSIIRDRSLAPAATDAQPSSVTIFPNPAKGSVNIQFKQPAINVRYEIRDRWGMLLQQGIWNKAEGIQQVRLLTIKPGLYSIKLSGSTVNETHHLVLE